MNGAGSTTSGLEQVLPGDSVNYIGDHLLAYAEFRRQILAAVAGLIAQFVPTTYRAHLIIGQLRHVIFRAIHAVLHVVVTTDKLKIAGTVI